jgi:hypothetical protein
MISRTNSIEKQYLFVSISRINKRSMNLIGLIPVKNQETCQSSNEEQNENRKISHFKNKSNLKPERLNSGGR